MNNVAKLAGSGLILGITVGLLLIVVPNSTPAPSLTSRFYCLLLALASLALIPRIWTKGGWPFLSWGPLVTIGLLAIASVIVKPIFILTGLGAEFYGPYSTTFNFDGPLGSRVLTPLIARALFLHGDRFYLLIYGETFLMVLALLRFLDLNIRNEHQPIRLLTVILGASAVALTSLVYAQLVEPSNVHVTSYLLITIFLIFAGNTTERRWIKVGLYMLLAANRLTSLFIFPFLILFASRDLRPNALLKQALLAIPGLALAVVLKLTIGNIYELLPGGSRPWLGDPLPISQMQDVKDNLSRTFSFLLSSDWYRVAFYPFVTSFGLAWLIVAGFLYRSLQARAYYSLALVTSAITFPLIQIFLATGWARYMGLAFPAILISVIGLSEEKLGRRLVCACGVLGPVSWFLYSQFHNLRWLGIVQD